MCVSWKGKREGMRNKAKKRGIGFHLSATDLREMIEGSGPCCPECKRTYSDIPNNPLFRSIDRIDPLGAYSLENTRVVCRDCNVIKGAEDERQHYSFIAEQLGCGFVSGKH